MKRLLSSLKGMASAARRFFLFLSEKAKGAARQIVRFVLFFEARRRRKNPSKDTNDAIHRIISWSEVGEPEDPQERYALFLERWYTLITVVLFVGLLFAMLAVFGNPIPRAWNSIKYIGESWSFIFRCLILGQEDVPPPMVSNESSPDFEGVFSTLKSAWFYVQAGFGGMTNIHILEEWAATTMNKLIDLIKFITWVPILIALMKIAAMVMVSPHKGDDGERTGPLRWWDETFVPKILRPIGDRIADYRSWASANGGRIKGTIIAMSAIVVDDVHLRVVSSIWGVRRRRRGQLRGEARHTRPPRIRRLLDIQIQR